MFLLSFIGFPFRMASMPVFLDSYVNDRPGKNARNNEGRELSPRTVTAAN